MIRKITDHEYFALPEVNRSGFVDYLDSPRKYQYKRDHPEPPGKALTIGTLAHLKLLEPEEEASRVVQVGAASLGGKEVTALRKIHKAQGLHHKIITPGVWWHQVEEMIEQSGIEKELEGIDKQNREVTATGTMMGLPVKAKADWIDKDGNICDLKTTGEDLSKFPYEFKKWRLNIQAAWYLKCFAQMDVPEQQFKLFVLNKKPPYDYQVFYVTEETLGEGAEIIAANLPAFKECLEADTWPALDKTPIAL